MHIGGFGSDSLEVVKRC